MKLYKAIPMVDSGVSAVTPGIGAEQTRQPAAITIPREMPLGASKGPGSTPYGFKAIGADVNAQAIPAPLLPEAGLRRPRNEFGLRPLKFPFGPQGAADFYFSVLRNKPFGRQTA